MQRTDDLNIGLASGRRRRILLSSVMTTVTAACALLAVVLLLIILGYIAFRGVSSLNLQFLIDTPKPVGALKQ